MVANYSPRTLVGTRSTLVRLALGLTGLLAITGSTAHAQSKVIRHITNGTERMEMTVNSSRILTLEKRIPRMVVNNPDLVSVTALSANQIQLAARKPGVTQVNLWDEDDNVFTVDVMIYGDVRELQHALKRLFPKSSIKVVRLTNSLVLEGFVERPEAVSPIIRLAEDYAPKVINNITVGGVQQVMLKVKVMEVSRTKLRSLGIDWTQASGTSIVSSSIASISADAETFRFGVIDGGDTFTAVFEALQRNNVAKILADPTIATISGRPAKFLVGGELPILVPSGLGQTAVEYKEFGTKVDFVPIVLGNGNVRLEVRSEVSEVDDTRGVDLNGTPIPAFKTSYVDTGVELKTGQTLALAGLVQTRVDSVKRGLPFVSDLPYIGAAFRSVKEEVNEIELLIMVTPEFADGMDPHQVPACGPGMESVSPSNCQLYFGGHLEVPSCGPCGPDGNCGVGDGCYSAPVGLPAYASDGESGQVTESYGEPTEAETPSSLPAVPRLETVPVPQELPDSSTMQQPELRLRNQMPSQFSREKIPYRNAQRQTAGGTTTPGLIGPIGYDVE